MSNYTEICLKPTEIMTGATIGIMRQMQNMRSGRKNCYGAGNDKAWQMHIEGALGELAFAKHLGAYYAGVGVFRGADVGDHEVRTRSSHSYDLILHPDDRDDACFWLLTGSLGNYRLHGWIKGIDGKADRFWSDPAGGRPAYFVPKTELNSPGAVADPVAA